MRRAGRFKLALMLALAGAFAVIVRAESAAPAESSDVRHARPVDAPIALDAVLPELLAQLDSDEYATRQQARRRIEQLVRRDVYGRGLARRFDRLLAQPDTSFEVRWHVQRWLERLPEPPSRETPVADAADLTTMIGHLTSPSFARRAAARSRLERLLGNPAMVGPVAAVMKQRLDAPETAAEHRLHLQRVWDDVRPIWAATDPTRWELPDVSPEEIDAWITTLRLPMPAAPEGRAPEGRAPEDRALEDRAPTERLAERIRAERELRDLIMRDHEVPRVRRAIDRHIDGVPDERISERLKQVRHACRPGLVAEYWLQRQHLGEQHLIVGVPSQTDNAPRPSHFDRIDDRVAHCVSGSSLAPGDYPVGVAFPHPREPRAFFRLVNLSTPRRRLAYQRHLELNEAERLRRISRRTFDRFLRRGGQLDPYELAMLNLLDPGEMSRFAGRCFMAIDDEQIGPVSRRPDPYNPALLLAAPDLPFLHGRPSHHGAICYWLSQNGTRAAVPGLIEALRRDRFLPPTPESPLNLGWIAALSLARRDPWPEVDAWLAQSITVAEPLRLGADRPVTVGTVAASLLLKRHDVDPKSFGLEPVDDRILDAFTLQGYRTPGAGALDRIRHWWRSRRADEST